MINLTIGKLYDQPGDDFHVTPAVICGKIKKTIWIGLVWFRYVVTIGWVRR